MKQSMKNFPMYTGKKYMKKNKHYTDKYLKVGVVVRGSEAGKSCTAIYQDPQPEVCGDLFKQAKVKKVSLIIKNSHSLHLGFKHTSNRFFNHLLCSAAHT